MGERQNRTLTYIYLYPLKILYIYRHPDMGFSIGKVFKPIEEEMRKYAEVDSVYMPVPNYKPKGLWKNIKAARAAVRKKKYDIVHITGAEHYLIPFIRRENVVVTVHDLGFFANEWPSLRAIWKYCLWIKPLLLAKKVTFISEKSKGEAERFVKFCNGQAVVVHNPVGPEFTYLPKKINTQTPVILHIGTKSNKNLERTIIALRGKHCILRIVGRLSKHQLQLLNKSTLKYEQVSDLTDEQILQEYRNCDYVNFPSLYEGFGMPIIEGQAVGRPVLTSNLSPMKEIAGEGAVIVDPNNAESIAKGYEMIGEIAENLVLKGLNNVRNFTLSFITKCYYELYKKIF